MLLKTLEKKSNHYLRAELDYREIKEHISLFSNGIYVTHLKKLGEKLGVKSKNTVKSRIRLFNEGKEAFVIWYLKDNSRSNWHPRELKLRIHEKFKAYKRDYKKYKKKRICFTTFMDNVEQKYLVDGVWYYPKHSYVHESLLDLGEYSSLSTEIQRKAPSIGKKGSKTWRINKKNSLQR